MTISRTLFVLLVVSLASGFTVQAQEMSLEARQARAQELAKKGDELFVQHQHEAAMTAYQDALLFAEDQTGNVYHGLGRCYNALGRDQEAMVAYERALEIKPDREKTRELLAELYRQHNETAKLLALGIE